jgi:hypothetical protein
MPPVKRLIKQLSGLTMKPDAVREYELLSDAFVWSDETPKVKGSPPAAFRHLLAYRSFLIRGKSHELLRRVWENVQAACPTWPGFRAERCSPTLARELERFSRRGLKEVKRSCGALGRDKANRSNA